MSVTGSKRELCLGLVVGLIVALSVLTACGGEAPGGETTATADGEALLQERCTECHDLGRVESAEKTREEWEDNVARMVSKGAQLDADEQSVLVDYLADTYAP